MAGWIRGQDPFPQLPPRGAAQALGGMAHDHCDEGARGHADRAPHLLCVDDCAPVMIPAPPVAPPADPLPRGRFAETAAPQVLDRSLEPEKAPPRV